jgi:hypothetical protein
MMGEGVLLSLPPPPQPESPSKNSAMGANRWTGLCKGFTEVYMVMVKRNSWRIV